MNSLHNVTYRFETVAARSVDLTLFPTDPAFLQGHIASRRQTG